MTAVIAWHGLARTGRDFDWLAEQLCADYLVVCPDTIGRGLSQWARDPKEDYSFVTYTHIAWDMMQALHIDQAHWIGTSMGGALGLVCAAGLVEPQLKSRIRSLVLNDIAPDPPLRPRHHATVFSRSARVPAVDRVRRARHPRHDLARRAV